MKVFTVLVLLFICYSEVNWGRDYARALRLQVRQVVKDQTRSTWWKIGLLFALILSLDGVLLTSLQGVEHPVALRFIELGGLIGNNGNFWALICSLYALARVFCPRRVGRIVAGAMFCSAITGLACNICKILALRARPVVGAGPVSFLNFAGYAEHQGMFLSFTSGDVALVAGAACFTAHFLPQKSWRLLVLILPALTALSRVYLNRHWPSDTLLSVALAAGFSYYLWRAFVSQASDYSQIPLSLRARNMAL